MISQEELERLIPLPSTDELIKSTENTLTEKGFVITNYKTGGVFYTILMIIFQAHIELIKLARTILKNSLITTASEGWLEAKAADYSKERKEPTKAYGEITLSRTNAFPAVRINKGHVFKSKIDDNGDELKYIATENVVFKVGQTYCKVPVEAEHTGSAYNVPQNTITESLIHIESVEGITNTNNWLTREGSDLENLESFRNRVKNSWAELATTPTRDKYKSICETVEGVLLVRVDDLHPRGQGTVDIIVTSTAGSASEQLLADVLTYANKIKGSYDNLLVKSSETVLQNIIVTLQISSYVSDDGLVERATGIINNLLKVSTDRNLNELYISDIIYALRSQLPIVRNILVATPAEDTILPIDKIILAGTITVTVERI